MDYKPLYISLGIFLITGAILNGVLIAFPFETEDNFLTNFVSNGISLTIPLPLVEDLVIAINPFSWFGDSVNQFFSTQAQAYSILPNEILIPLFILVFLGILYTIIGWVRGS